MAQKKKETAKKKPAAKPAAKAATKKAPVKKVVPAKKELKKPEPKKPIKPEAKTPEVTKAKKEKETPPAKSAKSSPAPQPQPARPAATAQPGGKKRALISFDKLPEEVVDIIRNKYPYGYNHDLKEVKGIDNKKFFVLPIELPDVIYLVKVDLRKPFKVEADDDEEDIFTPEEGFGGEEGSFPGEEIEPMDGEAGDDEEDEPKPKKKKKGEDDDDDDI